MLCYFAIETGCLPAVEAVLVAFNIDIINSLHELLLVAFHRVVSANNFFAGWNDGLNDLTLDAAYSFSKSFLLSSEFVQQIWDSSHPDSLTCPMFALVTTMRAVTFGAMQWSLFAFLGYAHLGYQVVTLAVYFGMVQLGFA